MNTEQIKYEILRIIDVLRILYKNDVKHLRLYRIREKLPVYKHPRQGEEVVSLYLKENPKYKDKLVLEEKSWYGSTKILKTIKYNLENFDEIYNDYLKILNERYLKISDMNKEDYKEIKKNIHEIKNEKRDSFFLDKDYKNFEKIEKDDYEKNIDNENVFLWKLIKENRNVGIFWGEIIIKYKEDSCYRNFIINDLVIDEKYDIFFFEYYIIDKIKRICHERKLDDIYVDVIDNKKNLLRKIRKLGFSNEKISAKMNALKVNC